MRKEELMENIESARVTLAELMAATPASTDDWAVVSLEKCIELMQRELTHIESGSPHHFAVDEATQREQNYMFENGIKGLLSCGADIASLEGRPFGPEEVVSILKEVLGAGDIEIVKLKDSGVKH